MPGKSPSFRPSLPEGDTPPGGEGSSQGSYGDLDFGTDLEMMLQDTGLELDPDPTQQRGLGDWVTQIPSMETQPEEETSEEAHPEFAEGHLFSSKDIGKCVQATAKKIHVTELQWDKHTVLGQIRPLSSKLVEHYVHRLKSSPPRTLVRILVKATRGV
jgi:hypothetical protein